MTFVVRTSRRPYLANARLRADPCRGETVLRVRASRDSVLRVSATFNGNRELKPRAGRVLTRRLS